LANLRILQADKGWDELGLSTWSEALEFFGLDETKWQWLQAGEPVLLDSDSVKQAEQKGRAQQAAQMVREQGVTQTEAAERCGITQPAVSKALKIITESSESEPEVISPPPDHLKGNTDRADWYRLTPKGQDRVRQGEPLNRVALAEGVRKRLTPLEQIQKAFRRLTREDQDAFGLWLNKQPR
jgi:DNA-binding MarR family transcriptional regulator